MAIDYLNKNGLSYFWSKLKAYFAPKAHTHNAFETKHSYTTAANAAKNWYRIANANTSQLDTTKPIRAQFIVTAYNTSYAADYYETWFVNAIVFGRQAHIVIFGGSGVPFSQARILFENTVANIDANDRPAIDLYLNYVLPNGTTKIEIEEIYNNGGWTFVADGQLAVSTVPSGFENVASAPRNTGVNNSTYADYVSYLNRQISNITAAFTLADSYLYRSRTLNCTGTFTITIPSINSGYMWCVIKNKNTSSGVITLHPSTTSVLIDGSNADITLQPMEYVCIHSAGANNFSLIADGRWKSKKADKATTLAGYGITDAKITNGTITLGSNSITPLTSVPSHNQASNTINAMTGYSKPSSGGSIAAGDTLNQAIGKLEKAIDDADISNVVHLTGDETISGLKKFLNNLLVAGGLTDYVVTLGIGTPLISMGEDPDSQIELRLVTYDNVTTTQGHRFGVFRTVVNTDGSVVSSVEAYQNVADPSLQKHAGIYVGVLKNGEVYAAAPSTSSTRTAGTDILTRNWIPNDTRIVHTTGTETIGGRKTFVSDVVLGNHDIIAPSDDTYNCFCGGDGESRYKGARLAVYGANYTNDTGYSGGFSLTSTPGGSTYYELEGDNTGLLTWRGNKVWAGISTSGSGNAVTAISVGTNNVVTVTKGSTFLTSHQSLDGCVKTSGNQTIDGSKTFSSSIIISGIGIFSNVNSSSITLGSGTSSGYTNGAKLTMYGATYSDSGDTTYRGAFRLMTGISSGHYDLIGLKGGSLTWNGQTVQTSSDERIKTKLQDVDDGVLSAWDGVEWGEFKYLDAVAEKGEASARLHVGLIAQQVIRAFAAKGLDACRYGICCHDESADAETGGRNDLWMVRYAEALCMEAAYMRRENARLKKRVSDLEERLAALELRLGSE